MKNFYLAITVKQDRNESIFGERNGEYNPGYYSCVRRIADASNLKSILDGVGGLVSANICSTKKRAEELADSWNAAYKANGQYLFDSPEF